jgi:hypothetical protein
MKIDKILFVSDSNMTYLGFWNSISKYYKIRFGIDCKLFFIGEKNSQNERYLSEEYGEVEVVRPLNNIPIIIQALWGKFWFTQTEPNTNWLIGDIDLYLLNKEYFEGAINLIPDDGYGHINAQPNWGEGSDLPGYFHCGSGEKFKEYMQLSDSFEEDCLHILNSKKYGIQYNGLIGRVWKDLENAPDRIKDKPDYGFICCEENLSTERLFKFKDKINSILYPTNLRRLETEYAITGQQTPIDYNFSRIFKLEDKDIYIDFHSPRPYSIFGERIEKIISNYV